MKKLPVKPLCAVLTCALLLSSCAAGGGSEASSAVSSSVPDAQRTQTQPETIQAGESGHTLSLCVSATDSGMYLSGTFRQGFSNLLYMDFSTRQEVFLCGNPNCAHDTDACTSYFSIDEGLEPFPVTAGNSLLLIQNGQWYDLPASIKIADLNGENRRVLFTGASGQNIGPGFYTDETGRYVYFSVSTVTEAAQEKRELCRLDTADGTLVPLLEYPAGYALDGIDRDCFVLTRRSEDDIESYYRFYPGYGEEPILDSTPFYSHNTKETGAFIKDSRLVTYDYASAQLDVADFAKGTDITIDCSDYATQPDDSHSPDVRGIYGDILMYEVCIQAQDGSTPSVYYPVDLRTGEFAEAFTLTDSYGNIMIPVAAVGDYFCLVYDYFDKDITYYADGQAQVYTATLPCYALIAQDDYKNSIPNLLPISNKDLL